MGEYIPFTEEQIGRANAIDLVEFLKAQGEKLLPSGREKRLSSNHSITVRGNEWYDHATEEGGYPIAFAEMYYDLDFVSAVNLLLGGEQGQLYPKAQPKGDKPKPFVLPPKAPAMRRTFAYLLKERKIDKDIVSFFAHEHLLYESLEKEGYHNAIFVGCDENGIPRHAHKRGLNTKSYKGNVEGSLPQYSFHYVGTGEVLYAFEAPIDLLSFLSLYPNDFERDSYVALCGTSNQPILWLLETYPQLQAVTLCLDNDTAGRKASERIQALLTERGYPCRVELPKHKDWNEDLQKQSTKLEMR